MTPSLGLRGDNAELVGALLSHAQAHGRPWLAVGDWIEPGTEIMFCRRDAKSAREDLARVLTSARETIDGVPRGGLYFSCLGRGEGLFGSDSAELRLIEQHLGAFPLIGFFGNGEISHDRLYGYTGVLLLFL